MLRCADVLQEERDLLVDKLLATTEALHASEARNRQSEASQGQVRIACLPACQDEWRGHSLPFTTDYLRTYFPVLV